MGLRRPAGESCGESGVVIFACALASCAELEKQGQIFAPMPLPHPRASNVRKFAATVQHKELVAQFGGEYRAPAAERYLDDILVKLAQASDTPGQAAYKVTILNTPVVNAFALPSGNLYVTRGLLALAGDASEVAAVMAHEIAHVTRATAPCAPSASARRR